VVWETKVNKNKEINKCDVALPKDDTTPRPTSLPSGPMTRARVEALHDKVKSILSTLDLNTTLDGKLPHANVLCVIRYEPREEYVKGGPTPDKEGEGGPLQPEATAQGRHCRPIQDGTTAGHTPALSVEAPRHCRPDHPGTVGQDTLTLPAGAPWHCRPKHPGTAAWSPRRPKQQGSALPPWTAWHCRPHQSQLHLNRLFSSCGCVYFAQMTKLP
jgi:hypothetical protein